MKLVNPANKRHYRVIVVGTGLAGRRAQPRSIEFAEPLQGPNDKAPILDNFKIWFALAVVLILLAYAWPIAEHLTMKTYGSPGYSPF